MKRLAFSSLFSAFVIVFFISAFNFSVDPIDIFNSPKLEGFNAVKPMVESHVRTWKAYHLNNAPEVIFLGTSRIMEGLDPANRNFKSLKVFNCGIPGGRPYEYEYYFNKALSGGSLKTLIIGLDEHAFYYKTLTTPDFIKSDFSSGIAGKSRYLLSSDIFKESIKTIFQQRQKPPFLSNGLENSAMIQDYITRNGHRQKFLVSEKGYIGSEYSKLGRDQEQTAHFNALSRILDKAYNNNINVILFISPSHARQWEVLNNMIGYDKFETWKRAIIALNEKEAEKAHKPPFPLWDFSGYNKLTAEEVPTINDTKTKMQWWWDSNHYKKELGDIVLDRMLDTNYSGGQNYPDFGVKLTSKNIESHLYTLRAQRQKWQSSHPLDIAEIEALKP